MSRKLVMIIAKEVSPDYLEILSISLLPDETVPDAIKDTVISNT